MFLIYIFLILVVAAFAVPLYRVLRSEDGTVGDLLRAVALLMVGVIIDIATVLVLSYYIEFLWFSEVQQQAQRFWQQFFIVWKLFGVLFVIGLLVGGTTMVAALMANDRSRRSVIYGGGAYGVFAGLLLAFFGSATNWTTVLEYFYHTPGGVLDPVFGKPLSFYLFELPFYESLLGFSFWLIVFSIPPILLMMVGSSQESKRQGRSDVAHAKVLAGQIGFAIAMVFVYIGFVVLVQRYQLVYGEHGVIHGLDWLRDTVSAPALKIIAGIFFASAAAVFLSSLLKRNWVLPVTGVGVAVIAVAYSVFAVALWYQSTVENRADHYTKNEEYVEYTMQFTRAAFGIDGEAVEQREFVINDTLTSADLALNQRTLDAARIMDYEVFDRRITQTQRVKPFYDFPDVDLDRYVDEDGNIHPVLVAIRNMTVDQIPASARSSWINTKIRYTHGYGVVVSPVNDFVGNGEPVYYMGDMDKAPTVPWLSLDEPRTYFGHGLEGEVYVNANGRDEFDRPGLVADLENRYTCEGGIELSGLLRRFAAVWETGNTSILFSDYIANDTRMIIKRDVNKRISALVPFMTTDSDWYVVIHEGRLVAVQDLYTTSDHYPFTEEIGEKRYMRGAAKATMDLCDGTVNFYTFDTEDPILQAYQAAFPGLFQPRDDMPANLQAHIRYPEYLYLHQYAAYAKYHVKDTQRFYNSSDVWSTPTEDLRGEEVRMDARYVVADLPGSEEAEFILMRPYVFKFGGSTQSKPKMTGWLAGRSDGEHYGKLVAYHFPSNLHVDGTAHIEQQINNHEAFREDFRNWNEGTTSWFKGNLIFLPLKGGQLVAIEPVFIEAEPGAIPELRRIISVQLRPNSDDSIRISWGRTYPESLQALLGYAHSNALFDRSGEADLTDEELIELVYKHMVQYGKLSGEGEYAEAGEQLDAIMSVLENRVGQEEGAGETVPTEDSQPEEGDG